MRYPAKMWRGRWFFAAGLVLLAATQLNAHHSLSDYNLKTVVVLRGPINRLQWSNPHTFVHVSVTAADGTVETWEVEGGSPRTLQRAGLTRGMLAVGTIVVINGWPAFAGTRKAAGRDITFPDGTTRMLESEPDRRPVSAAEWTRLYLPGLVRNALPYVVMSMPVAALIIGLYVLRLQNRHRHLGRKP